MRLLNWFRNKSDRPLSPQEFLAQIQQQSPPRHPPNAPGDLGKNSYERLASRFPSDVQNLFVNGKIAIGEVGILTPNAFAKYLPPAGYAIQFYTGMSSFLYRVSRALHTRVRIWQGTTGEPPKEPTMEVEQTMETLASIFRNFIRDGKIAGPQDYPIHKEQIERASNLATQAEDFIVAHEVGHIVIWLRAGGEPRSLSPDEEFEADKHALEFILGAKASFPSTNWRSKREIYAGAEFALRVFSSLDHRGYKFESTHPLPGVRLQKLREMALNICGGRREFVDLTTIAFSYDQLLESMERKIAREAASAHFVIGTTPERLLSTLSVITEEVVRGRLTLDRVIGDLTNIFSITPKETVHEAIKQASLMYFVDKLQNSNVEDAQMRVLERETFKKIAARMAEPFNNILQDVIATVPNAPPEPPPETEHTVEEVLSVIQLFVTELLANSDINDIIKVRQVEGHPELKQMVLAPKYSEKIEIIGTVRSYLSLVRPEILQAARGQAAEVYEFGTVEFSILLALLNTVQP